MAINYTNLFTMLGKLAKSTNNVRTYFGELDTDLAAIESVYASNSQYALLSAMPATYTGFKSAVLGWCDTIKQKASELLTDRDLVLENLPVGDQSDVNYVLARMIKDMVANTQSIEPCTVTVGSVTRTVTNSNAGTVIVDTTLDGYSQPAQGFAANTAYNGLTTEISEDDSVTLECVKDSENGGTLGSEIFNWIGSPKRPSPFHWQDTGTGNGPQLTVINNLGFFSNLDFETFTSNAPASWTIDAGTAGTHVFDESSDVYRGSHALKFTGNSSIASIQVSQASTLDLNPLRRYTFACYVKGNASISSGTLTIQFEGTGYTAGASEKISLNAATLAATTSYTRKHFHVNMPAVIPSDFKLVVKWTGTPSSHSVKIDGVAFGPMQFVNGVGAVIVAGSEAFLAGDKLAFTVANDDGGVLQTYFRQAFQVQMPSNASPTLSDTLAT